MSAAMAWNIFGGVPYAIAEAVQRPSKRCVPVKTHDQLDLHPARAIGCRWRQQNEL
jgi:hypothetical protein